MATNYAKNSVIDGVKYVYNNDHYFNGFSFVKRTTPSAHVSFTSLTCSRNFDYFT